MAVQRTQLDGLVADAVRLLRERIRVDAVYLFGSQASGDAHEHSDIDLAIVSPDVAELGVLGRARLGTRLRMQCSRDIEPHFFPAWALEAPPRGSFAEYVIKTGRRMA
jgi:predicted nucleotidyltransferase